MKFFTFFYFFANIVFVLAVSALLYAVASDRNASYTPGLVALQTVLVGVFVGFIELEKWLKEEIAFAPDPPLVSSDDSDSEATPAVLQFLIWTIAPLCACAILSTLDLSAPVFSVSCVGAFTLYQACFVAYSASQRSTKPRHNVVP